jgi:hypothetical protein
MLISALETEPDRWQDIFKYGFQIPSESPLAQELLDPHVLRSYKPYEQNFKYLFSHYATLVLHSADVTSWKMVRLSNQPPEIYASWRTERTCVCASRTYNTYLSHTCNTYNTMATYISHIQHRLHTCFGWVRVTSAFTRLPIWLTWWRFVPMVLFQVRNSNRTMSLDEVTIFLLNFDVFPRLISKRELKNIFR